MKTTVLILTERRLGGGECPPGKTIQRVVTAWLTRELCAAKHPLSVS